VPHLVPILNFSDSDTVILGDVNAHHASWFLATNSSTSAARGDVLAVAIENSALCILNSDSSTRLPNNGNSTYPDIASIFAHLVLSTIWTTHTRLNSDHLPITISFDEDVPQTEWQSHSLTLSLLIGPSLLQSQTIFSPNAFLPLPVPLVRQFSARSFLLPQNIVFHLVSGKSLLQGSPEMLLF
jgi:hypothetical protein